MFCLFLEEGGGGGGRNALPPNIMGALNKGRDGWDGSVSLGLTILWGWDYDMNYFDYNSVCQD